MSDVVTSSSALSDLGDIARPRRLPDKRVGAATWVSATGDYYIAQAGAMTIGHGSAVDMLESLERHGLRADGWHQSRRVITCQLYALDWSQAPV